MKRKYYNAKRNSIAFSFVVPCLIGFIFFYLMPTVRGLIYSFTDWNLFTKAHFIGMKNYQHLLQDKNFWIAMKVTILYVLLNIPLQTVLAVLIALVMNRAVRGSGVIRGIMLMPWIMSNVVVALLWFWMLDASIGIVNSLFQWIGLSRVSFFTSTKYALSTIAGINIWRYMGYTGLLVFAGLQSVPKELEEAAVIDGAGAVRTFFSIILPYIRPVMVFVILTSVIGSFQIYDTVAVTTKGGPVTATYVIYLFIFKNGFELYQMGYASAAAMILFVIIGAVSGFQMKIMRGNEADV